MANKKELEKKKKIQALKKAASGIGKSVVKTGIGLVTGAPVAMAIADKKNSKTLKRNQISKAVGGGVARAMKEKINESKSLSAEASREKATMKKKNSLYGNTVYSKGNLSTYNKERAKKMKTTDFYNANKM